MKTRSSRFKSSPDDSCDVGILDKFSIGHVMFGLVVAAFALITSYLILDLFPDDIDVIQVKAWMIVVTSIIALAIFVSWEMLEHGTVKRTFYARSRDHEGWCETSANMTADVAVGFIAFFAYYFITFFFFASDWIMVGILTAIPLAISPVVAYLVMKRKR